MQIVLPSYSVPMQDSSLQFQHVGACVTSRSPLPPASEPENPRGSPCFPLWLGIPLCQLSASAPPPAGASQQPLGWAASQQEWQHSPLRMILWCLSPLTWGKKARWLHLSSSHHPCPCAPRTPTPTRTTTRREGKETGCPSEHHPRSSLCVLRSDSKR